MGIVIGNSSLEENLKGYSTVMLIWAVLRFIIGLIVLVNYLISLNSPGGIYVWLIVGLIFLLSVYLFIVGRLGFISYTDRKWLKPFYIMSSIGLVLEVIALGFYLYSYFSGIDTNGRDIFSTVVECILFGLGVYYAWRIRKATN